MARPHSIATARRGLLLTVPVSAESQNRKDVLELSLDWINYYQSGRST